MRGTSAVLAVGHFLEGSTRLYYVQKLGRDFLSLRGSVFSMTQFLYHALFSPGGGWGVQIKNFRPKAPIEASKSKFILKRPSLLPTLGGDFLERDRPPTTQL